jgi:hypothetical protein
MPMFSISPESEYYFDLGNLCVLTLVGPRRQPNFYRSLHVEK